MARINIQYSIELDELAQEVNRLYKKASQLMNNLSLVQYSEGQILTSSLVKHIHEKRLELSSADAILRDVQSMVNSYVEYELSQLNDEVPLQPSQETEIPIDGVATLDDINSTLQHIKDGVENAKPPQRPT